MLRLMLWRGHFGDRLEDGLGRRGLEGGMEVRRTPQCPGER